MRLTQSKLKELLRYDPKTGEWRWRARPIRPGFGRPDGCWNAVWADQPAGTWFDGYLRIWIGGRSGRQYKASRLAFLYMTGRWPRHDVDHINRERGDDRWSNLRQATCSQNLINGRHKNPYKGARQLPSGRWRARFFADGKTIPLGVFDTRAEACAAYQAARRKHFGEFAD